MTRTELLALIRVYIQEPTAKKWLDPELLKHLDQGVEKVWGKLAFNAEGDWNVEESDSDVSIVSGTKTIAFPTKGSSPTRAMLKLDCVERVNVSEPFDLVRITKATRHRYEQVVYSSQIYPAHYYLQPPNIILVPEPAADYASALRFHGVWEHGSLVAADDEPRFAARYHPLAAMRAAMLALGLDESEPAWLSMEWTTGIGEMLVEACMDDHAFAEDTSEEY